MPPSGAPGVARLRRRRRGGVGEELVGELVDGFREQVESTVEGFRGHGARRRWDR